MEPNEPPLDPPLRREVFGASSIILAGMVMHTQVTSTSGMFPRFLEVTQFSSTQCTLDSFSPTCSIHFCIYCTNLAMNVYFKRCVRPLRRILMETSRSSSRYATVGFT